MRLRCAFSCMAWFAPMTCLRRASRSFCSRLARSLASKVSPTQLTRSWNGFNARLAPSWMGESTSSMPRWMVLSGPPIDSPKYAVRRINERPTSRARIALRLRTCLSYTLSPAAVARVLVGPVDRLELLQRPARTHRHAGQRRLGQVRWHADLGLDLLLHRVGGPDLQLDLLGGLRPDQQLVLALGVVDDRLVELVAADPDRLRDHDAAERDDGDLARAAADVDDHRARRLANREAGADRGGHRLLDQVRLARPGREACLLDRALLHAGHPRRDADHDPRVRPPVLVHLLDEVAQHLLGHVEVGDDAVLQRADGRDRARRAAEHALGLDADGVHLAGARVDRDHAGLGEHDAAAADVDEGVGGPEIDRHVAATETGQVAEEAHAKNRATATGARRPDGWAWRGPPEGQCSGGGLDDPSSGAPGHGPANRLARRG